MESDFGTAFCFDGARGLHFTTENATDWTRVSLDLRIVAGDEAWEEVKNGGGRFVSGGFYNIAVWIDEETGFVREGESGEPDQRMGMPFV